MRRAPRSKHDKADHPGRSKRHAVTLETEFAEVPLEEKEAPGSTNEPPESSKHFFKGTGKKREHVKIENEIENEASNVKKVKRGLSRDNWKKILSNLGEMGKNLKTSDYADKAEDSPEWRYQTLLSLLISSRTKEEITDAAMLKLKEHGCTIDNILATSDEKLGELIYPVSFWKTKVRHIKKTTEMLKNEWRGDIPKNVEDLCKLPGVGPKVAHLCMQISWGEVTGMTVDAHVHRVSNRLSLVKTKTPEDTRKELQDWLPKEDWKEVDTLLMNFGQQICQALKPQCVTCLNNTLCSFGANYLKKEQKKKK